MSSRRRPVSRSGAGEEQQMEMSDAEPSSETAAKASGASPEQAVPESVSSPLASSPTRRPAQRLDSLRGDATSASGAMPSGSKKPLKYQPKFTGRRSKAERDALAQAENERLRAQLTARATEENSSRPAGRKRPTGEGKRPRGSGGYRGRGGYMGESMVAGVISSGVFSPGSSRRPAGRGGYRPSRPSGSGTARVKDEPTIKPDLDADFAMLGINLKREYEDGGELSSDPEDRSEVPRKNVDFISLISDDEEENSQRTSSNRRQGSKSPVLAPIRITRKDHVQKAAGLNVQQGSSKHTEARRKVEESGDDLAQGPEGSAVHNARTSRSKVRDVEVVRAERKWKGVYVEDDEEGGVSIKKEPREDPIDLTEVPPSATPDTTAPEHNQADPSPDKGKRTSGAAKSRRKIPGLYDTKPVFQTEEDMQEWHRNRVELDVLKGELTQSEPGPPSAADAINETGLLENEATDKRADHVYLFQFPPIVPDLSIAHSHLKTEPGSPSQSRALLPSDQSTAPPPGDTEPIKVEDDEEHIGSKDHICRPTLASGRAGKLRVHESGRVTLSWGGTSLELSMGTSAHFLQDTVLTSITPEAERISADDAGEAISFGQIRGKFVITPDWSDIVG